MISLIKLGIVYLGEDPLQFLVAAQKGDMMIFLE
jgi:hypothetical protein